MKSKLLLMIFLMTTINSFSQKEAIKKWPHVFNDANYRFGLIGDDGRIILQPNYDYIENFNHPGKWYVSSFEELDYAVYRDSTSAIGLIDKYGNVIFEPRPYRGISVFETIDSVTNEKYCVFNQDNKLGFINEQGVVVVDPKFNRISFGLESLLKAGITPAAVNDKHGYIDKSGTFIIQPIFDNAYAFHHGYAWVKKDEKFGAIDLNGNLIIDFIYERAYHFNKQGIAAVTKNDKLIFIDSSNNVLKKIKCQVKDVTTINEIRFFIIKKDENWGMINEYGKITVPIIHDFLKANDSSELIQYKSERNFGFIDTAGNIKVKAKYELVYPFLEGDIATVYNDKKYWLINKQGEEISGPFEFYIFPFRESDIAVFKVFNNNQEMNGLINSEGEIILQPIPAKIVGFRNLNLSSVIFGKRIGLVDKKGIFYGFKMEELKNELNLDDK